MRVRFTRVLLASLFGASLVLAQSESPGDLFRRGNESAARSRWDDAIIDYGRLAEEGVRAPSLYWNWAQAAAASGRRGEALWALLQARDLAPRDSSVARDLERLRGELGLDPSEVSLGFLGDARAMARHFRFDGLAIAAFLLSMVAALLKKPGSALAGASFLIGLLLITPVLAGQWREARGVVVQKDAPLVDIPREDAVALANLREGEVVPLLGEEGDYVRIQDASGARGFAHKNDVRRVGLN